MGLEGTDFKGLNNSDMIFQYYSPTDSSPIHEGREKYKLTISHLQCRGLITPEVPVGRSFVFVVTQSSLLSFSIINIYF